MAQKSVTFEVEAGEEESLLRHFHGLLLEMRELALNTPAGEVLDVCEATVVQRGQDIARQVLQQAVQQRIDALEKKGRRCEPVIAAARGKTAAPQRGR